MLFSIRVSGCMRICLHEDLCESVRMCGCVDACVWLVSAPQTQTNPSKDHFQYSPRVILEAIRAEVGFGLRLRQV